MATLPGDEQFRKAVSLEVPHGMRRTDAAGDHVTFHAESVREDWQPPKWEKPDGNPNYHDRACYSPLRPNYRDFNITCFPTHVSPVSLEMASEFFQLLVSANIVRPGFSLFWDSFSGRDGVHCHIKAGLPDSRDVYVILTAYRWINAIPALVWETLALHRLGLGISTFQILAYLNAKHVKNYNHSFIICQDPKNDTYRYVGEGGSVLNPLVPAAMQRYFNPNLKRPDVAGQGSGSYVNEAIKELAAKLTPKEEGPEQIAGQPWRNATAGPKFLLERREDILHPSLQELYTDDFEPTIARAEEILTRLSQKKGTACLAASAS